MYNPTPLDLHSTSKGKGGSNKDADDDYSNAIVTFVDIINNTFDANGIDGVRVFRAVTFAKIMPNFSGDVDYPVSGDFVCIRISRGVPYLDGRFRPADAIDPASGMPMHRFANHPYLRKSMPGDRWWFGIGGSFLGLLRGGLLKIGVSPMCQLIFMKFENMLKVIVQQWKFISCGIHAYSINDNGSITTRLSFFRKDAMGQTCSDDWSNRSDYDVLIDTNGLSLLSGSVDPSTWLRSNKTIIQIKPNGDIFLAQGDIDNQLYRQTVAISGEGTIETNQYDETMQNVTYHKCITQCGDTSDVSEYVKGDYMLNVGGRYSVAADEGFYAESDSHILLKSDISIKLDTSYLEHAADIKNL